MEPTLLSTQQSTTERQAPPEKVTETWTEIRCVACVPLGWYASHLLLRLHSIGKVEVLDLRLQMKCPRCKSVVEWHLGTPEFIVIVEGTKNHKRQTVAFE